jgi:hypothetical protein
VKVDAKTSVCIVGAGPAGLTAAFELKKRGYTDVTVFEKQDRVGGQCFSFEYPHGSGRFVDMAATEMSEGYTNVMRLAGEVGARTVGDQSLRIYDRVHRRYLSAVRASILLDGFSFLSTMWAGIKYTLLLLGPYRRFTRAGSGLAHAPAALRQPLGTWSRSKGLEPLALNYAYTMQVGYGREDDLCAAYFVKFQNTLNWISNMNSVLGVSRSWPRYFRDGFQSLWERVARHVHVELGSEIVSIRRVLREDELAVEVQLRGEAEPRVFDQLILGCQLELDRLAFLDITESERPLFERIRTVDYFSTACVVRGLPDGIVVSAPAPAEGNPTGYIRKHPDDEVAVFFSIATPDSSEDGVRAGIERLLESMPAWEGKRPKLERVVAQKRWQFFPHVRPEDFAAGFFERLEALQGHRNTLYVSSIASMSTVEDTVGYTRAKIIQQFPDLTSHALPWVIAEALVVLAVAVAVRLWT